MQNRKPLVCQGLPISFCGVIGTCCRHLTVQLSVKTVNLRTNRLRTGELSVKTAKSRTKVFGTGHLSVKTADSRTAYTYREQKRPKTWPGVGPKALPAQTKLSFISHRNGDHTATPSIRERKIRNSVQHILVILQS